MENGRPVAIKICKQGNGETENAFLESKILNKISNTDPDVNCLIKIYDSFMFRRHFLIVTEMLDTDLYGYMKKRNFNPIKTDVLKGIAT